MNMDIRDFYFLKRRKLGITLQQIADYLGVHKSSISRLERSVTSYSALENQYRQYIDSKGK